LIFLSKVEKQNLQTHVQSPKDGSAIIGLPCKRKRNFTSYYFRTKQGRSIAL
jgi:hypothetical protein